MKKKKRVWIVSSAALLFAGVATLIYFATREHPDYVRAAKGLPAARKDAEKMFGPFTWEEYREERGITFKDDIDAWDTLKRSMPRDVSLLAHDDRATVSQFVKVYSENKAWFSALSVSLAPLELHQLSLGESHRYPLIAAKNLVNAIGIGIEGSAETGDEGIMEELTLAAWLIFEQYNVEPNQITAAMIISGKA